MDINSKVTIIFLLVVGIACLVTASFNKYVKEVRDNSIGKPSILTGIKVSNYVSTQKFPEEVGSGYFENDILSPKKYKKSWKWPGGKVYYTFSTSLTSTEKILIKDAMNSIQSKTTKVKFIPRTSQSNYVIFENKKTGCWSALGRVGGDQTINLQSPQCYDHPRTAIHLLLHTLGLPHENNRDNRDNFIAIQAGNIVQTFEKNFKRDSDHKLNTPYDYYSAMHFTALTNSENGKFTFLSKSPSVSTSSIGWVTDAQASDISKIEELY